MATQTETTVTVRIDPNATSIQSDIISPATQFNAGVMTAAQARDLAELIADDAEESVLLYADPTTGSDANPGTSPTEPVQTFAKLMDLKPALYHKALRFYTNISQFEAGYDPAAQNTDKKIYDLSDEAQQYLFPECEGDDAESVVLYGGFSNLFGDKSVTLGGSSATALVSEETLLLNELEGALITIVSGPGSTNAPRIVRSNTAGANAVITPEAAWSTLDPPGVGTVYRVGRPNVEIRYKRNLLFAAPTQNLFMNGIDFVYAGSAANTVDFQVGNQMGTGGGGAIVWIGVEWNGNNAGVKANLRIRGTARLQLDGASGSYWVGPSATNPFPLADYINTGNHLHDGNQMTLNAGGAAQGGAGLIKGFAFLDSFSFSSFLFAGGTIDSPMRVGGGAVLNLFTPTATLRGRIRKPIIVQALGQLVSNSGPALNNCEVSDITGDMVTVQQGGQAFLGNVTVAGVNTGGVGLKVLTGGKAIVQATTALASSLGAIQVDGGPILTLAQAMAAPFLGTLTSNVDQLYPATDPGNTQTLTSPVSVSYALTSAGVETRTLANPTWANQRMAIWCSVFGGNITIACAGGIDSGGNTGIRFTAAGQAIFLEAISIGATVRWRIAGNDGATILP